MVNERFDEGGPGGRFGERFKFAVGDCRRNDSTHKVALQNATQLRESNPGGGENLLRQIIECKYAWAQSGPDA